MKVLIADDDGISRLVLQLAVERLGHECIATADGREAWAAFTRHGADVIISDWMMPGMEGPELCRRIRAHDRTPYTYFVLLTVLEDKQHAIVGMEAGADDYLTKPLDLDDLRARLIVASRVTALHQRLARRDAERESRLQDLVGRLLLAQEEERRRIAYDVHDGLAQIAAAAHQHLEAFASHYHPSSPTRRANLERAQGLVQETVREARRVIAGLRPTALDDFGLATAIRIELDTLRADGWEVTYDERPGRERLPSRVETALFRIAQEALANVRKHAQTQRVQVTLEQRRALVRLEVRDWGRGFGGPNEAHAAAPGERVGIPGMEERATLLGGHCTVESAPGVGTRVVAEVPLADAPGGEVARAA